MLLQPNFPVIRLINLIKINKKKIQNIWNIPNILYLWCMIKFIIKSKGFKLKWNLSFKTVRKVLKWIIF